VSADVAVAEAEFSLSEGESAIAGFRDTLRALESELTILEHTRMNAERTLASTKTRTEELSRRESELTNTQTATHGLLEQLAKQLKTITQQIHEERAMIAGREQQTLLLGAHGPQRLFIVLVDEENA
jgi:chromosome segregation ATPase